jgi:hypothetical protein
MAPGAVSFLALLSLMVPARGLFLAGMQWRDFDKAGIVTAVGFVNLTLDADSNYELTAGSNFTVVSSLFSCNVAQRLDPATGRLVQYVVPEGEGDEITKMPYTVDVFAADRSGAHVSSAPEGAQRWDVSSIADAAGAGADVSFGLATRPPMNLYLPVYVVSVNSTSGAVENVTDALPGVQDVEECASAVGSSSGAGGQGTLLFVINDVHTLHRTQQVLLFDVALRKVVNVLTYPDGILSAIVGWRNKTSGEDLALAFMWPAVSGAGPALVAFDPAAATWAPRVLWAFDASVLPMPKCLAVDAETDTAYGLLMGSDCPPLCFTDIQVGVFSNLSSPASFASSKAFVAPKLQDVFPVGISQCAVVPGF